MTGNNPFDDDSNDFETDSDEVASDTEDVGDVEVIHETSDEYVVIYPDGTDDVLPKNEKNRLMVEYDMYDVIHGEDGVDFSPKDHNVALLGTGAEGVFFLDVDSDRIQTPMNREREVIRALRKDLDARKALEVNRGSFGTQEAYEEHMESIEEPGVHLFELYQDMIADRVRVDVVNDFVEWFPSNRVEVTNNGWIVDDTFIVTFEAENYSLDDVETHKIQGGEVVEAEEDHQFAELEATISTKAEEFSVPDSAETQMLGDEEQFFLATVEKFISSEDSVGGRFAAEVRREKARQEGSQTHDAVVDLANSMRVVAFRDAKTGLVHRHPMSKHTLTANLGVTQDVVDEMHYSSYDHAAVTELLARRDEFEERAEEDEEFEIFSDVDSEDEEEYESRWENVESTREAAVIPDLIQNEIRERFGSW